MTVTAPSLSAGNYTIVVSNTRGSYSLANGITILQKYNLTNEFSLTNNPNGVWSYGSKPSVNGSFTIFSNIRNDAVNNFFGWNFSSSGAEYDICVIKNYSGNFVYGVPSGYVTLHPGPNPSNIHTVVRWTAPISGTISIQGSYLAGDSGLVDLYIVQNSITFWSQTSTSNAHNFNEAKTVNAGDTIDFVVGNSDNYFGDSTPLDLTIRYQ